MSSLWPLLPFWLVMWTFGGVMAITEFARTESRFCILALRVGGWMVAVALIVAWLSQAPS